MECTDLRIHELSAIEYSMIDLSLPIFNIADQVRPFIAKLWERAEEDLEALRNNRPVSVA